MEGMVLKRIGNVGMWRNQTISIVPVEYLPEKALDKMGGVSEKKKSISK